MYRYKHEGCIDGFLFFMAIDFVAFVRTLITTNLMEFLTQEFYDDKEEVIFEIDRRNRREKKVSAVFSVTMTQILSKQKKLQ